MQFALVWELPDAVDLILCCTLTVIQLEKRDEGLHRSGMVLGCFIFYCLTRILLLIRPVCSTTLFDADSEGEVDQTLSGVGRAQQQKRDKGNTFYTSRISLSQFHDLVLVLFRTPSSYRLDYKPPDLNIKVCEM